MTTYTQKEIAYGVEVARWVIDGALQFVPNRSFEDGANQLIHVIYHHPESLNFNHLMKYADRRIERPGAKTLEALLDEHIPAHGNIVHIMESASGFSSHIKDEKYTLVCSAEVYRWATLLFVGCCRRDSDIFTTLDDVRAKLQDPGGSHIQVFLGTVTACLFYAAKIVDKLVEPPEWVREISESVTCSKPGRTSMVEDPKPDRVLH